MSLSNSLKMYNVGQLLKDPAFKREVCLISKQCSSGSSGGGSISTVNNNTPDGSGNVIVDLQSVTNAGNISSNAIIISGATGFSTTTDGVQVIGGFGIVNINTTNVVTPVQNSLTFDSDATRVIYENNNKLTINGTRAQFENSGNIPIPVVGADATNPDEFITLRQIGVTNNQVITSDAPIAILSPNTYYTYNNINPTTWTFPDISEGIGTRVGLINIGAGILTVNANDTGQIYVNTAFASEIVLNEGETNILYNNSLAWVVIA